MLDKPEPTQGSSPWKLPEERQEERDQKREAVLRTATELFIEKGYHRVTMNEIAAQLNITKPALYNYFESKSAILAEGFRISNALAEKELQLIEKKNAPGLEKLRSFIRRYAQLCTVIYSSSMIRLDDRELAEKERMEVRGYKRAIDTRVREIITEGISDGSIRLCDVRLAAFSILGALNMIGQWYHPHGAYSPEHIGNTLADYLTNGLTNAGQDKQG